jgi:glyoxylase-like metal-dependent hydrolase (beta-lactamase superfamily II)
MYQKRCVLVDAGKTMRDACMRVLPKYGVANVDGILLTHGHADAILGLDDVR